MIVPMSKVYVVARQRDRDRLLATLAELGMVHLVPVDADRAVADDTMLRRLDALKQALQMLSGVQPAGATPDISAMDAAHEALEIHRRSVEGRNRLAALYHQLEQIAIWDNLRLDDVRSLREAGVPLQFYSVPVTEVDAVEADCVADVADLPGRRTMVGVVDLNESARLPESATALPLPPRDAPSIREEARELAAARVHLAGAVGTNAVVLYGPAPARVVGPRAQHGAKIINLQPDMLAVCKTMGHCWGTNPQCTSPCIHTISPAKVKKALKDTCVLPTWPAIVLKMRVAC